MIALGEGVGMRDVMAWISFVVLVGLQGVVCSANDTLESVQSILDTHPDLRSIDDLVPLLGADLRENYSLLYKSESMQQDLTSPLNPRVVSVDKDGRFFAGYVACSEDGRGSKDYPPCERYEILYEESPGRLAPMVLSFPGKEAPPEMKVKTSRPDTCMECHGDPMRPLWDYDMWRGVYGSILGVQKEHISYGSTEHGYYGDFVQSIWNLKDQKIDAPKDGASPRYTELHWRKNQVLDFTDKKGISIAHSASPRPSTEIAAKAVTVNMNRLFNMLHDHPEFESFKYAIQWWGKCFMLFDIGSPYSNSWQSLSNLNGYEIDSIVPESYRPSVSFKDSLPPLEAELREGFRRLVKQIAMYNDVSNQSEVGTEAYQMYYNRPAPMLYRLFAFMGLSTSNLTTSMNDQQALVFTSKRFGLYELTEIINRHFKKNDPDVSNLSCEELKARSVRALEY